jgi:hypothetical protein
MIYPYVIEEITEENVSILSYGSCQMDQNGLDIFVTSILDFLSEAMVLSETPVEKIKKREDLDRYYQGVGVYSCGDKTWKAKIFMHQWENVHIGPKLLFCELERRRNEKANVLLREMFSGFIYVIIVLCAIAKLLKLLS